MPVSNHGGFDAVLDLDSASIQAIAGAGRIQATVVRSVDRLGDFSWISRAELSFRFVGVVLSSGNLASATFRLEANSRYVVEAIRFDNGQTVPLDEALGTISPSAWVEFQGSISGSGLSAVLEFPPAGAFGATTLDGIKLGGAMPWLGGAPVVQAALVYAYFTGGSTAVDRMADTIRHLLEDRVLSAAKGLQFGTTPLVLAAVPPGFFGGGPTISRLEPIGTPIFVGLRLMLTSTGSPGSPALISSRLRSSTTDWALVISNSAFLRDFVRPMVAASLGIPLTAFPATDPCFVVGPVLSALPGLPGPTTFTFLSAGLSGTGSLDVLFLFQSSLGPGGMFTARGRVAQRFTVTALPAAAPTGLPTLFLVPIGSATVEVFSADLAPWAIVASLFGFGGAMTAALGYVTQLVSPRSQPSGYASLIGAFRIAAFPIVLPAGMGAPTAVRVSTRQAGATQPTFPAQGLSFFLDHDVLLNFA